MRIHNLYTDANGQSHFRDIEVEWVEEGRAGKLSKRLPATGIIFREVQPAYSTGTKMQLRILPSTACDR